MFKLILVVLAFVAVAALVDLGGSDERAEQARYARAMRGAADGLWQHTCCEAFVAAVDGVEYHEFNFSPSGQWAAYRFLVYRERDTDDQPSVAPTIGFQRLPEGFRLDALIARELLPAACQFHIGLTAVIEAAVGGNSYWALAHCATQPDFHLRQSFSLTLDHPICCP